MLQTVEGLQVVHNDLLLAELETGQRRMGGGAVQTWETLVNAYQYSGENSGATLENSVTITDISPGAATAGLCLTLPANMLMPGNILRYAAKGWFSTTAKPAITIGIYFGAVAGTALATVKLETPETVTELPWALEATSRVVSVGNAGKIITQGLVWGLITPRQTEKVPTTVAHLPESKPQTEVTVETGIARAITVGATWGAAAAANKITCTQWLVEILN